MPPPSGRSGGGGRSRWIPVVALTLMLMAAATMMHLIPNTEPSIVTATPVVVKSTRAATTSQPTSTRPRRTRRPSSNPAASGGTVPNGHALLASWNEPYQETRRALRERQGSGKPLTTHTFYTIDCTHHSLWQSMTLEASWEAVGQGGFLSRVTSGCESAQHKQPDLMRHTFEDPEHPKRSTTAFGPTRITGRREDPRDTELCPTLLDCFGIFFVPAFHVLPNGDYYAPYNRPNGIWYWLNNTEIVEDVLVLLDPDMIYLSRLRGISLVKPGAPAAMYYNYMDFEKLGNYDCPLCPKPGSFNRKEYAVGPPWMIRSEDLKLIMSTWIQLVPMLREKDKGMWIVEMVAYSVACAFHSLPHTLLYKSMVDNVAQDKAWVGEFIAGHENTDVVVPLDIPPKEKEVDEPIALLHYCYTWEVGETNPKNAEDSQVQHARQVKKEADNQKPVIDYFHWSKYRTPSDWPGGNGRYAHNVFSCDCPLLQEFHTPWAFKGSNRAEHQSWLRNAMFMHLGLPRINYALGLFKAKYCSPHGTNMKGLIRTSHPSYWVSNYVITNYSKTSEGGVTFVPASDTTTRAEGAALPTNMQKVD